MTNIKVKEITYKDYGRCVELSNGKVEVVITLDLGPRVIRYGLPGKANMSCNNMDESYEKTGWKIYGGHRVWISPEHDILSYEPDNDPIEYRVIPNGVHIIGNLEKGTGLRKEIFIRLEEEGTNVALKHCITNNNIWPTEFAAWALSVMAPGGKEVLPINKEDTGLLGNCCMSLWPYTKMNDERVWWGNKYITLKSIEGSDSPFKLGITNPLGWAAYFHNGMAFVKKFQYFDYEDCEYPDNGMNYETYTNDFMLEMESLSPITVLQKDESIVHLECWSLLDDVQAPEDDDALIDALFEKIMPDCVNNSAENTGCCDGHQHHDGYDCEHDHHHNHSCCEDGCKPDDDGCC